ncbi:hypothetical protein B0H13DRAFT_2346448 [Mycena leptocephala]|nr:hypothetical protein B0H13DRAFT_2346448 [Mycena leptocephala]
MAEEFTPIAAARPAPRAIFRGAPFEKDHDVGGSPGTLFQAFTNSSSSSLLFTFGAGASMPFAFTPCATAETLHPVTSRQLEAPISVANATPQATTTPSALSVFSAVVVNATAAVDQQRAAAFPPPAQAAGIPPHASAVAPPGVNVIPGFFQSRPMGNTPKGHPLAATTKKATAPKKLAKPRKAPVPAASESIPSPVIPVQVRGRGRPCKTAVAAPAGETVQAPAIPDHASAIIAQALPPATLTGAAATAEAARIRREDATNRKLRAEVLQREKAVDAKAAAEAAEAKREQARLHNPAGGANLFIMGSRPKRAITATKNPDGSARMKKCSPAELAAEEDQRMLDGFANQKHKAAEDLPGSGAPKKGKTAAKGKAAAIAGRTGKRKAKKTCTCK